MKQTTIYQINKQQGIDKHRELYSLSSISPVLKNLPANAGDTGDLGSIPGSGRSPGVGNGNPLQFLPRKSHGQRSLWGYNPWRCRKSDTTECFTVSLSLDFLLE